MSDPAASSVMAYFWACLLVGVILAMVAAILIGRDAAARGMSGFGWGVFTFSAAILAIPIYLVVRTPRFDVPLTPCVHHPTCRAVTTRQLEPNGTAVHVCNVCRAEIDGEPPPLFAQYRCGLCVRGERGESNRARAVPYENSVRSFLDLKSPRTATVGSTTVGVGPELRFAGFWCRTLASVIDNVLSEIGVFLVVFPIVRPLARSLEASMKQNASEIEIALMYLGMGFVPGLLIPWLYYTVLESSNWQATPGKKLLGLRVTDEDGRRIDFGKANARYWLKFASASILGIGYIMIAFSDKKQGLHDRVARTLVLQTG